MADAAREGIARSETEIITRERGRTSDDVPIGPCCRAGCPSPGLMMCPMAHAALLAVPAVPHLDWQVFWQLPLKIPA